MKKYFLIFLSVIFLSSCVTLESPVTAGMSKNGYCSAKNLGGLYPICYDKYYYYEDGIEVLKKYNTYAVFKNVTIPTPQSTLTSNNYGNGTFVGEVYSWADAQRLINNSSPQKKQKQIEFTIKDKQKQCEAIGFEPETEKFADCVLRLVELDVKDQQNKQIVSAESSGNQALVDELKKQRDLQASKYLLDLGEQLRNPQTTNSNIYMPQTQRCTIQGFGTFAKMVCR